MVERGPLERLLILLQYLVKIVIRGAIYVRTVPGCKLNAITPFPPYNLASSLSNNTPASLLMPYRVQVSFLSASMFLNSIPSLGASFEAASEEAVIIRKVWGGAPVCSCGGEEGQQEGTEEGEEVVDLELGFL